MTAEYPYAEGDLLDERNTYAYTPYGGRAFLEAWRRSRDAVLDELPPPVVTPMPGTSRCSTALRFDDLAARMAAGDGSARAELDLVVRNFEVTKRIFGRYDDAGRPVDRCDYRDPTLYVRFAEVIEVAYEVSGSLTHLNALLKCLDTVVALRAQLPDVDRARLARLIALERAHVTALDARVQAGT